MSFDDPLVRKGFATSLPLGDRSSNRRIDGHRLRPGDAVSACDATREPHIDVPSVLDSKHDSGDH